MNNGIIERCHANFMLFVIKSSATRSKIPFCIFFVCFTDVKNFIILLLNKIGNCVYVYVRGKLKPFFYFIPYHVWWWLGGWICIYLNFYGRSVYPEFYFMEFQRKTSKLDKHLYNWVCKRLFVLIFIDCSIYTRYTHTHTHHTPFRLTLIILFFCFSVSEVSRKKFARAWIRTLYREIYSKIVFRSAGHTKCLVMMTNRFSIKTITETRKKLFFFFTNSLYAWKNPCNSVTTIQRNSRQMAQTKN